MAESLDDGEFWLPPKFLTDDDVVAKSGGAGLKKNGDGFGFEADSGANKGGFGLLSFDSPFGGFGSSDLSSPGESVVGSTETESDEEDLMAGLARQMARYSVWDDVVRPDPSFSSDNTKGRSLSGSPQSTLCSVGSGCMCQQGSSRGSPNGSCQVSPPPATWDLLYAAAGEVARMRMNNSDRNMYGLNNQSNRVHTAPPRKPSPVAVPAKNPNPEAGFYHHQSLSHQRLQAAQFQLLKQQQMLKQQQQQQQRPGIWGGPVKGTGHFQPQQMIQNRARNSEFIGGGGRIVRPVGLSPSAWPPLQQAPQQNQQNGSGMRAMFLGAPGAKRESTGTGVFLPRRKVGAAPETRKKPVCSTVLLPARVVQALNLNLEEPRFNGSFTTENDAALRLRSGNVMHYPQRRSNNHAVNHEIRLPQEWTY